MTPMKEDKEMKVWVLTSVVNDYNQYGEYFEAVFKSKPSFEQLRELGVPEEHARKCLDTGGGRIRTIGNIDEWWLLREHCISD